jgi:tRNA(Arg) A34 adenosine deaminase TadA
MLESAAMSQSAEDYMRLALAEADYARQCDEVPIGAVLVNSASGEVVTRSGNRTLEFFDPSAHAEMLVIREGCRIARAQRIPEYDLYVTLEPCAMCAAAISFARIRKLYFGAYDRKGGGVEHGGRFYQQATCHHRPQVEGGVLAAECGAILKDFFSGKRQRNG